MIHRYPHEVSILEVAPPTNLAMAIRKDPTIIPLIKQIVTMAGQIVVKGNAYLDNAEFNWWFDPEATQIVLRADIPHVVVPLDCTNTVPLTQTVYNQIANARPQTVVTKLFADTFVNTIGSDSLRYRGLGSSCSSRICRLNPGVIPGHGHHLRQPSRNATQLWKVDRLRPASLRSLSLCWHWLAAEIESHLHNS